jgi:hypothetical protein
MEGQTDASDVEVEVSGGTVTLKGTVDSRQGKYQIEELADRIPGVKDVNNEIRVKRSSESSGNRQSESRSGSSSSSQFGSSGKSVQK